MITSAILNGLSVSSFAFTKNFYILIVSRVTAGFFKVMFVIYFPVWIDLCAPQKSQTMWISFYFLMVPMGIILGIGLSKGFNSWIDAKDSYKWGFAV
jgi:hypothetical protein